MKKLSFIFIAIAGILSLYSCKKDETKMVLTDFTAAQVQSPATGTNYVLTKPLADSVLVTFTWSAATFKPLNFSKPTYSLEYDTAGGTFASPKVLKSTTELSYSTTEGAMNLLILNAKGKPDELATYQFRVKASLSDGTTKEDVYSSVITLGFTPYSTVIVAPPLYLLGDATTVGWNNNANPPLICKSTGEAGKYAIVAHLLASKQLKFQATLGQWVPQWGTDATGTTESGPLIYRETEVVPDPAGIPSPALEGDYRITADIEGLTYTITATSATLYVVGDATTAGWVNTAGLPFIQDSIGYFSLTTTLTAGGMKFLEVPGQWAPQWGTDAAGTSSNGNLIYRPTESVPDPINIVSPGAGIYTIRIDLVQQVYTIVSGSGK